VNGQDLIAILKEFELRFGEPVIAGGYAAHTVNAISQAGLLGEEPDSIHSESKGKTYLMDCECGVAGCWPFFVRITREAGKVVWDDFEQPHRLPGAVSGHWDYSELQPFVFDEEAYLQQVPKLPRKYNQ
jgi:hypothetical protein